MADVRNEAKQILRRHAELKAARGVREALWRDCERWVDPNQQGGFWQRTPGGQRDQHITDDTARIGIETFEGAMNGMLTPEGEKYTPITTSNQDLNEDPQMKLWLQHATDRVHACRNAAHTGYAAWNSVRWRMQGIYGWGGFWTDENVGKGLFYKTIHPSELYIDDDFRGQIDTVHREFRQTARQISQMFHDDLLPAKVRDALSNNKPDEKFTLVHVLRPNSHWEPGRLDAGQFRIQSIYLLLEGEEVISVGGYRTMPLAVSRYALSPNDVYGVGPSGTTMGSIKMLNLMTRDEIRATHLGMQPPILMPADGTITRMEMTPGAPIPGGMENGKRMIDPFMSGVQVAYNEKTYEKCTRIVDAAFLTHVFAIMNEPIDRQTATEYQGRKREAMLLMAPMAGRQMGEAIGPQTSREVEILIRAGQIRRPPPVFFEAGAGVMVGFDNPVTRAVRSADAENFMGGLQMIEPMGQIDPSVFDVIDTDRAPRGVMESMGVRADWLATPEAVAAKRQNRQQAQQAEQLAAAAPAVTQGMLNIAKARQATAA